MTAVPMSRRRWRQNCWPISAAPTASTGSDQDAIETLTAREEQILDLLGKGLRNKEIARQLDLKEKTVKHYVTNILQKLQLRNRVEAAVLLQKQSKPERLPE